jgi:hypothetical protein
MIIYSDSQIVDLEWIPNLGLTDYTISHDFVEFVASADTDKIAITTHRLHCDYDQNCAAYQGFEDKINQLSAVSRLVFTIESELHNFHWQMWERCHHDNVYWVVPGTVNDRPDMSSHIVFWGDWFKTTAHVYKQLPGKLAEISYQLPKLKHFDALLGTAKPHRDFVAQAVIDNNLQDKIVMPYGGRFNDNEFYAKDYFIWEPGITVATDKLLGTADTVKYYGVHTGLSRVIPVQVFNDCAYSIVAETDHDNSLSFYTEKTAKVLVARRLFVAFTGYKFLQNLRSLGFQTFGEVVDESYDLIVNDTERYTHAFEQVKKLCSMDQAEVYAKIKPVLEHNYNLVMTRDWTQHAVNQIRQIIL